MYGAFATTLTLANNISARFTAAYLAHEGLELVRNYRDNNFLSANVGGWAAGIIGPPCDTGCQIDYKTGTSAQTVDDQLRAYDAGNLNLNSDGLYSYETGGMSTIFKRKITTTLVSGPIDSIRVEVSVFWNYNNKLQ